VSSCSTQTEFLGAAAEPDWAFVTFAGAVLIVCTSMQQPHTLLSTGWSCMLWVCPQMDWFCLLASAIMAAVVTAVHVDVHLDRLSNRLSSSKSCWNPQLVLWCCYLEPVEVFRVVFTQRLPCHGLSWCWLWCTQWPLLLCGGRYSLYNLQGTLLFIFMLQFLLGRCWVVPLVTAMSCCQV